MITFDYYFHFWLLLWSTLELLDRALYKLSFIYLLFIRKIYPVHLEFIKKKKKDGKSGWRLDLATKDLFHLKDEFSEFIPLFLEFTEKINFF